MKKTTLLLLLLFPGCLAATTPMGANNGSGGDGDKSAVADSFISAPPSVEAPPVDAPPAGSPPSATPTSMMRSLPGDPQAGGLPTGDQPIAFAAPGPIDPKTDQGAAHPLLCTSHRFRYGPDFSLPIYCIFATPMRPADNGDGTTSLHLLLEKNTSESQTASGPWAAVPNGIQVRLVRSSTTNQPWESQFIDAKSYSSPEGDNVLFPSLPVTPGFWNLFVFTGEGLSPDFQSAALKPFPDEATYEAEFPKIEEGDFVLAGRIEIIVDTVTTKAPARLNRVLSPSILESPPPPEPLDWKRLRLLKDIYQSKP